MSEPKFKVHSNAPDAYIVFFPYTKEQTPRSTDFDESYLETTPVYVRSELLSISTSKGKTGGGSWSCEISSSKNYKAIIHPGCWAMIHISNNQLTDIQTKDSGIGNGLKMLGLVKSVRVIESLDRSSGTKTIRYIFSGSDFHTVLESQVYINRMLVNPKDDVDTSAYILFKRAATDRFKPDQAVKLIIEGVLGKNTSLKAGLNGISNTVGGTYAVPPAVVSALTGKTAVDNRFVNTMNLLLQKDLTGQISLQPELGGMFACWSLVQTYSHRLLNEAYTDLLPVGGVLKPTVILRAIPFSSPKNAEALKGLATNVYLDADKNKDKFLTNSMSDGRESFNSSDTGENGIGLYVSKYIEGDIISLNYGKSDSERFNFFYVVSNAAVAAGDENAKIFELTGSASLKELTDPNSLARHGLRPFVAASEYITLSSDHIREANIICRDLWSRAHLFENGTITIVGSKEHIPVGTNIVLSDRGWFAHVERVDHSYSVSSDGRKSYTTSIAFVRLQTNSGQPIDLVDKAAEHEWDRKATHSLGDPLSSTKGKK